VKFALAEVTLAPADLTMNKNDVLPLWSSQVDRIVAASASVAACPRL
jgi:hypothetical protein